MKLVPPMISTRMQPRSLQAEPRAHPGGTVTKGAGGGADRAVGVEPEQFDPIAGAPARSDSGLEVPLGLSGTIAPHLLRTKTAAQTGDPTPSLAAVPGEALQDRKTIRRKVSDSPMVIAQRAP